MNFPSKEANGETIFIIRRDLGTSETQVIELNDAIELISPDFILENIASEVYGDHNLWYIIADANLPKHPGDWKSGDLLSVPLLGLESATDTQIRKRVFSLE